MAELHEHCRRLGVVHPDAPLHDEPWGTREFAGLDPDGDLIGLPGSLQATEQPQASAAASSATSSPRSSEVSAS